jgi:hypothetical protein
LNVFFSLRFAPTASSLTSHAPLSLTLPAVGLSCNVAQGSELFVHGGYRHASLHRAILHFSPRHVSSRHFCVAHVPRRKRLLLTLHSCC